MKQLFFGKKYASYFQFYLQDSKSKQNQEEICTDANFEKSLGVGNQMIVINTARYADVEVKLCLFNNEPKLDKNDAEKVNECSIKINNKIKLGNEVSSDWTEYDIDKGIYRVRILYKKLSTVVADNGNDAYHIEMWAENELRETLYLK